MFVLSRHSTQRILLEIREPKWLTVVCSLIEHDRASAVPLKWKILLDFWLKNA